MTAQLTAPQFAHHLNRRPLGDGATVALNAALHNVTAAVTPGTPSHKFPDLLADALTTGPHVLPLFNLVELETQANKIPGDDATLVRVGVGRAVTRTARHIILDAAPESMPAAERARKLLAIKMINQTGMTPRGIREDGAHTRSIAIAEIADAADWELDGLMLKVHGDAWLDMQEAPLNEATTQDTAQAGGAIYNRWLAAQVNTL